jgi:hypothetical protein
MRDEAMFVMWPTVGLLVFAEEALARVAVAPVRPETNTVLR